MTNEAVLDIKIVFLGALNVGKTAIIHRYCNNRFQEDTVNTIGAGFFTHSLHIDNLDLTLLLWDTSGEERFRSVAPSLLRGANGLVLVYDLTNPKTFDDANVYLEMFLDTVVVDMGCELPVLLLGNKLDCISDLNEQQTTEQEILQRSVDEWCEKNRIVYKSQVSAKSGEGVSESIESLVRSIITPDHIGDRQPLQLTPVQVEEKKSGCC